MFSTLSLEISPDTQGGGPHVLVIAPPLRVLVCFLYPRHIGTMLDLDRRTLRRHDTSPNDGPMHRETPRSSTDRRSLLPLQPAAPEERPIRLFLHRSAHLLTLTALSSAFVSLTSSFFPLEALTSWSLLTFQASAILLALVTLPLLRR